VQFVPRLMPVGLDRAPGVPQALWLYPENLADRFPESLNTGREGT